MKQREERATEPRRIKSNALKNHPFLQRLPYVLVILSFLGFLDALYLTLNHYQNAVPPCSLAHGCETVLTSQYASVGPVPIALIGVFYYLALLILSVLYLQGKRGLPDSASQRQAGTVGRFMAFLVVSGLVVSAILFYLQAAVIHAFCQYCLASEAIILLFFISYFLMPREKAVE